MTTILCRVQPLRLCLPRAHTEMKSDDICESVYPQDVFTLLYVHLQVLILLSV